jgi:hypothetical protein
MTIEDLIKLEELTQRGDVERLDEIVDEAHRQLGLVEKVAPALRHVVAMARQKGATK